MPFPPDLYFECCPRPCILLFEEQAIDITMDMYSTRYLEEVWPEDWDTWEKRQWFCGPCNMPVPPQEDQRCPICDAELVPPSDEEEGYA